MEEGLIVENSKLVNFFIFKFTKIKIDFFLSGLVSFSQQNM